jgi:cytoskeleton protein RodZ
VAQPRESPDDAPWVQRLREERERRGLSRGQVAEDLHVDEYMIVALEAGQFASLGAPVFARGHLRKYAALLGLEVDKMLAAFDRESAQPLPELVPLTASAPLRPELAVKWLGAATVAAMVLGVAWWALTEREPAAEPPPVQARREPATPAPAPVVAEPVAAAPESPVVPSGAPAAPAPGTTVRLRLNFSADSWAELYDAGGQRVFFDLGSANSVRNVTAVAPVKVFLGYADGVQLELNGKPLALPDEVRRGNVARFTVDERGNVRRGEG